MKTLHPLPTYPADPESVPHPTVETCKTCCGMQSPAQQVIDSDHWLKGLLRFSLPRMIYDCAWGTFHWNGHFMASDSMPWKQEPVAGPMPLHFRISYFTLATVISVMATFAYGAAIGRARPDMAFWHGGLAMLLIAGPGWVLQAILALTLRRKQALDYLSHMATVMWKGTIPLAVLAVVVLVAGPLHPMFFVSAVLISALTMARAHYLRVNALGLSQAWTLSWFLLLQVTAWTMVFCSPFVSPILQWQ